MTVPTWPELVRLMASGQSRDTPLTGILEVDCWYSGDHRSETLPNTVRVSMASGRYRVETLAGEVLFIRGHDRAWRFPRSSDLPILTREPDDVVDHGFGSYSIAIDRPRAESWCDRGLDGIVGEVTASVYLGRDAWDVEVRVSTTSLATAHLTIDAATGMVLRWGSELFGDDFRWTRLHDLSRADDALFVWDGEAVEDVATIPEVVPTPIPRADPLVDAPRSQAPGLPDVAALSITVSGEPEVFEMTQDGSFHLGYDLG
ncbi:MAG: hypothetical protein ABW004_09165, partial [Aeromicrobium sp.]